MPLRSAFDGIRAIVRRVTIKYKQERSFIGCITHKVLSECANFCSNYKYSGWVIDFLITITGSWCFPDLFHACIQISQVHYD